jgi:hypothetical protein
MSATPATPAALGMPASSAAFALPTLAATVHASERVDDRSVRVVVRVAEGVDRGVVRRSLEEAARIFRRGRISVEWLDRSDDVQGCVRLHVLARDVVGAGRDRPMLGVAPRERGRAGRIAYVFVDAVERLAGAHVVDASLVLGAAIAHELGHLLLPDGAHSGLGLMRAQWGRAEVRAADGGNLRFSPHELSQMRAQLPAPAGEPLLARFRP